MGGASTASRPDAVERRLPPEPASVGEARRLVRDLLVASDREDLLESGALVVSEVVTNALLHAGTPIDVAAWVDGTGLRVEVSDGSPHLPARRRYATTAGTGRGMLMLESVVDDWGVTRHDRGKTVWFHLTDPAANAERQELQEDEAPARRTTAGDVVRVELLNMPLLLHAAWQEHAEALLREYLLASLDDESDINPIQMHADATDAIAILEEQVPRADVAMDPDELMAGATEPFVSLPAVVLEVPLASVPHFRTLSDAIEASIGLARTGRILTPPTQPEVRAFRRWLCTEVVEQARGRSARPWSFATTTADPLTEPWPWDMSTVRTAAGGLIAADETNRILAVSREALDILGYDDPTQIEGRRLVTIIPERYRQAHIAGFTLHLLVGRQPLVGRTVEVPALRADGAEVLVDLVVTAEKMGNGRTLFLADIRRV
ncbi:ATP-binding protein [Nocardioides iriomotensis]|uniref:PAS domain S-box protein n=1 Tax=Nocardioides iriomotensis TaxID=715784 RepID=A0A4Q5IYL6_9ACTN|nr:ATP-binding protein [Nocardioides iriomotensis]RYU10045.1 PAS domain S-box protein [Nocardioides iriomotensis]